MTIAILFLFCTALAIICINKASENKKLETDLNKLSEHFRALERSYEQATQDVTKNIEEVLKLERELKESVEANSKIVSQKQSVLTRTGAMVENIVPLLNDLPYDPTNMHHLGKPVDFLYFNYDDPEPYITFVEVKSGKAKESKRQRTILNIIKEGKVHYELLQITDKGIKVTRKA